MTDRFEFVSCAGPDELAASDAKTTLKFQPTEYELLQLCRHWTGVALEEIASGDGPCGFEPFRLDYANRRLDALIAVIGEPKAREIWDEQSKVREQLELTEENA